MRKLKNSKRRYRVDTVGIQKNRLLLIPVSRMRPGKRRVPDLWDQLHNSGLNVRPP
jgi:hypothetical protein